MEDQAKTKAQLIAELSELREQVVESRSDAMEDGPRPGMARLESMVSTMPAVPYICRACGDFGATFVSAGITSLMGY